MTEYVCYKCKKNFGNKKDHLERHINKKKSCVENNDNILQNPPQILPVPPILCQEIILNDEKPKENIFECEFCLKTFAKKFNVDRHLKICSVKKEEDSTKNIPINELKEIKEQLTLILKQNEELKKESENLKKQLVQNKPKSSKSISSASNGKKKDININIVNNVVNNQNNINNINNINNQNNQNNQNNIVNFNNMNLNNVDRKLFVGPIMNTRLFGKEIILKMIENIYINESLPEYQNIVITDKNRGYVKIYNNGKWKTDNIQIINLVINGIIEHSKTIWEELNEHYMHNIQAKQRLGTSKKYIDLCDLDYLDELEDEQANGDADNLNQIKRCKDFRDMVYKDTINLFHDNKNILLKPKNFDLIDI